jgi:hypothetical protein
MTAELALATERYHRLDRLKSSCDSRLKKLLNESELILEKNVLEVHPPEEKLDYFLCRLEYLKRKAEGRAGITRIRVRYRNEVF